MGFDRAGEDLHTWVRLCAALGGRASVALVAAIEFILQGFELEISCPGRRKSYLVEERTVYTPDSQCSSSIYKGFGRRVQGHVLVVLQERLCDEKAETLQVDYQLICSDDHSLPTRVSHFSGTVHPASNIH